MLRYKLFCVILFAAAVAVGRPSKPKIVIYPAPSGEPLSTLYKVSIAGRVVPVYMAKIGMADNVKRFKAVDDLPNSADYYDTAAFAYFDLTGHASVTIGVSKLVKSAKVLPLSAGIKIVKHLRSITFTVSKPQDLTIEINGEWIKSLHLFVNPVEKNVPGPHSPGVLFFGPGIHFLSATIIGSNKSVYISGGAIVRSVIGKDEKFGIEPSGLHNYAPRLLLAGRHIKLYGRGIIDAGACPVHAGNFIVLKGTDITVEGIIIRNSCGWTLPVRQSDHISINNIKILGYRANSDGIDICNSSNVTVENSFIRTNDDLVVVKTEKGEGQAKHITIKNCVLFNQLANALSLGAELRENVDDVLFSDCDIIHDQGRAWSLRIFQTDSSLISNIRFENLRIEESHTFILISISKDIASYDKGLGQIRNITFKNIHVRGEPLNIDLVGFDKAHIINGVEFQNIRLNDLPLQRDNIKNNIFVENISVK